MSELTEAMAREMVALEAQIKIIRFRLRYQKPPKHTARRWWGEVKRLEVKRNSLVEERSSIMQAGWVNAAARKLDEYWRENE